MRGMAAPRLWDRSAMEERPESTLLIRISAVIGILACVGDTCMIYLLGTWDPGYKPFFQTMSDLGHEGSPVARIVSTGWVIMGLMFIIFGFGFYRAFVHYGGRAKTAGWMLALYGIGEGLGSGLIPGTPGRIFQTTRGILHTLISGVGLLAAMLLPFIILNMFDARKSSARYWYPWLTAVSAIFFFLLFAISNFYSPDGKWISYLGLWQRLYMLTYFLFFIYLAVLMLVITKPNSERVP
jgi:hypothetical membrane protein